MATSAKNKARLREFGKTIYKISPCGHEFRLDYLLDWITPKIGCRVTAEINSCPECKQPIVISPDHGLQITLTDFSKFPNSETNIYVKCVTCEEIFLCVPEEVVSTSIINRNKCESCTENKIFKCPGCGLLLQHGGGCSRMTCCKRGDDCDNYLCKKDNHGSTPSITFCGKEFKIDKELKYESSSESESSFFSSEESNDESTSSSSSEDEEEKTPTS